MPLSRRLFLCSSAAALALPRAGVASPFVLRAGPATAQILPEGDGTTEMLGYNGQTPGPELRVRQGDTLSVRFENGIDEGSAVHWHGLRIENAMDGVPGLTQPMVEPGESFDYSFAPPDAGTFWYHSHNRSWEQVARGLYGPLIVEERNPPRVDHDITVIIDDWRLDVSGEMMEGFGNLHDFSHAGRLGNYARVLPLVTQVARGARVRLRLINTATARVFPLELTGLAGKVVALDGMPLIAPMPIEQTFLAPAQRMDIIADVEDTVRFLFPTRGDPYELGEITAYGEVTTPLGAEIAPLAPAAVPAPAETPSQTLTLRMEGGAMGGQHDGGDVWAFNGVSGMTKDPWARFSAGETARLTLINDTAFPHGIHMHGHHFHEVTKGGSLGPLRDTTLLQRQETREIVCVFDNPGKWLLHCHMLEHQVAGMKTWFEVT